MSLTGDSVAVVSAPEVAVRSLPPPGFVVHEPRYRRHRAVAVTQAVALHVLVVAAYAVPAVALWWHAWDGHLGSTLTCACGDAGQEVWFIAWPAYAIAHGLDPFFSRALQVPYGVNLLSNASATPVGVVLAPVTWVAGPIVATNVALTLCPALSAWACWVACRRLVSWQPAAVVAGALFGYSPFMLSNLALGHVSLCLLVAPPLLVVACKEAVLGAPARRRRWAIAIGCLLALQGFISSEILVMTVVLGVPAMVAVAVYAAWSGRCRPLETLEVAAVAVLVGGALLAFPMWFALYGPQHITGPPWPSAIVDGSPVSALWSSGPYRAAADNLVRLGGYHGLQGPPPSFLGPAVLGLVAVSLGVAWRRLSVWLFAAVAALAAVFSWGAFLFVTPGHAVGVWTPWQVLGTWPLLADVIPQRFSVLSDLFVVLVIAIGLDRCRHLLARLDRRPRDPRTSGRLRRALVSILVAGAGVVAVASLWWTYQVPMATTSVSVPRWFSTEAKNVAAQSVVLAFPFPFPSSGTSQAMVWQSIDTMHFRLAGAYAKVPGPSGAPLSSQPDLQPYETLAALSARAGGPLPTGSPKEVAAVRAALARWRVDYVVVTDTGLDPRRAVAIFTRAIGASPRRADGAWTWAIGKAAGR